MYKTAVNTNFYFEKKEQRTKHVVIGTYIIHPLGYWQFIDHGLNKKFLCFQVLERFILILR